MNLCAKWLRKCFSVFFEKWLSSSPGPLEFLANLPKLLWWSHAWIYVFFLVLAKSNFVSNSDLFIVNYYPHWWQLESEVLFYGLPIYSLAKAGIGNLKSGLQIYLSMFICLRILTNPSIHKYGIEKSCLLSHREMMACLFCIYVDSSKSKNQRSLSS